MIAMIAPQLRNLGLRHSFIRSFSTIHASVEELRSGFCVTEMPVSAEEAELDGKFRRRRARPGR